MTDQSQHNRDRDMRAAELALGLLDGVERADAERELLSDPEFRAAFAFWTATSECWLEDVPPMKGTSNLWPAIEAAIDEKAPHALQSRDWATGRKNLASAWAIAATGAALIAGTTALLFYQRDVAARQDKAAVERKLAAAEGERQVAQITGDANRVLVSALYDPASGTIDLRLDLPNEPRLAPELWVIPADGKPRSLGTFTTADAEMKVSPALRPYVIDGATLAVTMEPAEGAPHGAPSGPVLGSTQLKSL